MIYSFYTIHVLICLFLILVVLLQQGKGADLSVFGGGSTMTAFGARGAATLLHKMTVYAFIGFIVTTLAIGILQGQQEGSSVMSVIDEETTTTGGEDAEPASALPEEEPLAGALPADGEADGEAPISDPPKSGDDPAPEDGGS